MHAQEGGRDRSTEKRKGQGTEKVPAGRDDSTMPNKLATEHSKRARIGTRTDKVEESPGVRVDQPINSKNDIRNC